MAKKGSFTVNIKPARGWALVNMRDLIHYRELIYFMTWRDIKVRYRQTVLGVGWVVLRPILAMLIFTLFGGLAKIPSDGVPYPVFYFTALLPWELFTRALQEGSRALTNNSNMITKIYFPRVILPLGTVLAGVVDFCVAFLVLLVLMLYYQRAPAPQAWMLPFFLLLAVLTSLGISLWLSALNVLYRDVGYVVPYMTQFLLFITPVVYPVKMIPEKWQIIYSLNPMAGVIEGFRWAWLGVPADPPVTLFIASAGMALAILISGLFYFRRMERLFADMI